MGPPLTESTVEEAALEIFEGMGYAILHGPGIAPGELFAERAYYGDVVTARRLARSRRLPLQWPRKQAMRLQWHSCRPQAFHRLLLSTLPGELAGRSRREFVPDIRQATIAKFSGDRAICFLLPPPGGKRNAF
ncbi:MAG TPA: hypothetical protein VNJ52_10820 [Patescibacteria group bacterium]|nr:hypothetical protein [Patescibacteria group bacterium]